MTSRRLEDLHPEFRPLVDKFLDATCRFGLDVLVYCTIRSPEDQAREFRKGRDPAEIEKMRTILEINWQRADLGQILMDVGSQQGDKIVTKAGPGMSLHQYGYAFDGCPLDHGRYPEDASPLWGQYQMIAREIGLWVISWESPHVQFPNIRWQELIKRPCV